MEWIIEWDKALFLFFNSLHIPWIDKVMWVVSGTTTWIPLYLFLIFSVFKSLKKEAWKALLMIVLTIGMADGMTAFVMKPYFKRLRPSHEASLKNKIHLVKDFQGNVYYGGLYGFASSHAANTFGLAMICWYLFKNKWRYVGLLFFWAFLLSYSRIYLGVHYPLDLIFGGLVGLIMSFISYNLFMYYFFENPK